MHVEFIKRNVTLPDEDCPFSSLKPSMLGAVSEFEHALIRERQREGIALAKARGVYKGQPKSLNPEQVQQQR